MGNCINSQQVVSWADDDDDEDWELNEGAICRGKAWNKEEDFEEVTATYSSSSSSSSSVVVKMRMTKRQLNELMLRLANKKGVDVERVLAHVMNTGAVVHRHRRREGRRAAQWAPRLESIPEASENELPEFVVKEDF